jgi:hypothetical protein
MASSDSGQVVSATVILRDEDDFAGMNEEWLRWFPVDPPARQAEAAGAHPGLARLDCRGGTSLTFARARHGGRDIRMCPLLAGSGHVDLTRSSVRRL